jgi:hypothetical protein
MKASLKRALRQQPQVGVQYLRRALNLLEWGRTIWRDVPKDDRGAIFLDTFVTGLRGMYLRMFMEVSSESLFLGRWVNSITGLRR